MDDALYRIHAEREESYWWWVAKNRIILSLVDRYAPPPSPGHRALDIGCGAGAVLARLSERYDAVGIDTSPIARDFCAARGLRALHGSLPNNLPFAPPDAFQVIVMSEVIEHVKPDRDAIAAASALLSIGGVLICTVPAHRWLWSSHDDFNHHVRRYSRSQFAALFHGLGLQQLVLSYTQMLALPLIAVARVMERSRTSLTGRPPPEPTVRPLWTPINALLRAGFEAEKHILPRARIPVGSSIISVHRRSRS